MKRVLMLAYYFAPRNHIASMRPGCFAKFLPENGWLPTIICDEWGQSDPDYNPDIIGTLPAEVEVHGIRRKHPHNFLQKFVSRKLGPYLWPAKCPYTWWHSATLKAKELLSKHRFDVVWATSDPLVPLAVGCEVARVAGLPLVADIRDSYNVQRFGSWYKRPFQAAAERRLCSQASEVITVSQGLAEGLSCILRRPVHVINNGYDPTLLPERPRVESDVFRLLYAGLIMLPQRSPATLLQAVRICIERGVIPRNKIEIVFLGTDPELVRRSFPEGIDEVPVRFVAKVPHREALMELMKAAVLISLTHKGEKGVLTGKIFDYLAANRPIMALPDDHGEIHSLLESTGAGVSLSCPEDICRALNVWYEQWLSNSQFAIKQNSNVVAQYSRRQQTKELAKVLENQRCKRNSL
jgi:glycosyltransferase involved in cell wall biosynthesis